MIQLWSLPVDPADNSLLNGNTLGWTKFMESCLPRRTSCVWDSYVLMLPIRLWSPPHHDDWLVEDSQADEIGWHVIAAHELGHAAGIVGDGPTSPGSHQYVYPTRSSDSVPPWGGSPPSGPGSVMVAFSTTGPGAGTQCPGSHWCWWARPDCACSQSSCDGNPSGPYWTNMPTRYDAWDDAQVRIK